MRLRVACRGLGSDAAMKVSYVVPRLGDMSDLHVWMLARHSSFAAYSDLLSLFTVGGEARPENPPVQTPRADDTNDTKITLHSQGPLLEPPRVQHYKQTIPRQTSIPKVHFWNLPACK